MPQLDLGVTARPMIESIPEANSGVLQRLYTPPFDQSGCIGKIHSFMHSSKR